MKSKLEFLTGAIAPPDKKAARICYASLLAAGLTIAATQPAGAVTFAAASGTRAASATFNIVSGDLQVVLSNTSASDALVPVDVLHAVFFDITGVPSLPRVSALLAGSAVFNGPNGGGNVGGEWAYASGLSGAPFGATQGISSAGYGLFGPADNFGGANLQGPADVDGLQYGITSAGDNPLTGNMPMLTNALIQNSVTFDLGPLPVGFSLTNIGNVSFQYGTALSDPNITPPIPEPETYALMLAGLGLMGFVARRRRSTGDLG